MSKFAARIFEQKLSNLVENDLKEAISKDYSTYLNRLDR